MTRSMSASDQRRVVTLTGVAALVANVYSVTTPKFPPPPPRQAQNRSAFCAALARTVLPLARTTLTAWRASQVRPYLRSSKPMPPPSVRPETPTVAQVPVGTVRANGSSAAWTAYRLAPAPTTTVRLLLL